MNQQVLKKTLPFLSFFIPFFITKNYVINHIYIYGSGIFDVGWFTYLMSNELTWPLQNPEIAGLKETFFATHFSPFFYFTSFLYKFLFSFISPQVYFASFIGLMYGLISTAVYISLNQFFKENLFIVFLISVFSAFNGASIALIGFPHIEIAIPALIMLFLALYFTENKKSSYLVFFLLMTIREDAGFHLFGVLFFIILIAFTLKSKNKIQKNLIIILSLSLIYSILAMWLQKNYFPGDDALRRVYLGEPLFQHINKEFLYQNLKFFLTQRGYLYLPFMAAIFFSIYFKNKFLLVAFLASIPWFLLSFIAISPMPHTFSNYYGFVFITALSWTSFAFLINYKLTEQIPKLSNVILSFIFITVVSILTFNGSGHVDPKPWKKVGYNTIKDIDNFINYFSQRKEDYKNILFDEPTAALFVKKIKKNEYAFLNNFSSEQMKNADTVLFFKNKDSINPRSIDIMKDIITSNKLNNIYEIKNSSIVLASRQTIDETNFLIKSNEDLFSMKWNAKDLPSQTGSILDSMRIARKHKDKPGYITFGPYVELPKGDYKFDIVYSSPAPTTIKVGNWDVVINLPESIKQINNGDINGTNAQDQHIKGTFTIESAYSYKKIEIRNFYNGVDDLSIQKLMITKVE